MVLEILKCIGRGAKVLQDSISFPGPRGRWDEHKLGLKACPLVRERVLREVVSDLGHLLGWDGMGRTGGGEAYVVLEEVGSGSGR